MKKVLFILVTLSMLACEEQKDITDAEELIIGKWKLVEYSYSIGGPEQIVTSVDDGGELVLYSNLNFTDNNYPDCLEGTFTANSIDEEANIELTLNYTIVLK